MEHQVHLDQVHLVASPVAEREEWAITLSSKVGRGPIISPLCTMLTPIRLKCSFTAKNTVEYT